MKFLIPSFVPSLIFTYAQSICVIVRVRVNYFSPLDFFGENCFDKTGFFWFLSKLFSFAYQNLEKRASSVFCKLHFSQKYTVMAALFEKKSILIRLDFVFYLKTIITIFHIDTDIQSPMFDERSALFSYNF